MKRDAFPNLHPDNSKIALVEGESTFTYSEVDRLATLFASGLLSGAADLNEERIAFFCPPQLTTSPPCTASGARAVLRSRSTLHLL